MKNKFIVTYKEETLNNGEIIAKYSCHYKLFGFIKIPIPFMFVEPDWIAVSISDEQNDPAIRTYTKNCAHQFIKWHPVNLNFCAGYSNKEFGELLSEAMNYEYRNEVVRNKISVAKILKVMMPTSDSKYFKNSEDTSFTTQVWVPGYFILAKYKKNSSIVWGLDIDKVKDEYNRLINLWHGRDINKKITKTV